MVNRRNLMVRLESLGHWFFYLALRLFGHLGGIALLVPVVFTYVLFSRKIHGIVRPYLIHRFSGAGKITCWVLTFRNIFAFGQVLVERGWLGVDKNAALQGDFSDYDTLVDLVKRGKGLVLLTSHVGNWQSALAHLGELPVKVHVLMRYDQRAAAKHFFDLQSGQRAFEIIDAEGDFGGMVDALAALKRGEVVTIMGDRYIKGSSSTIKFLGDEVRLPNGAYMLAASAGAPVAVLLAAKTGRKSYELKLWDQFYPEYQSRDQRDAMLRQCSARYMKAVEEYLKLYPFQWYNFYDFWKQ